MRVGRYLDRDGVCAGGDCTLCAVEEYVMDWGGGGMVLMDGSWVHGIAVDGNVDIVELFLDLVLLRLVGIHGSFLGEWVNRFGHVGKPAKFLRCY